MLSHNRAAFRDSLPRRVIFLLALLEARRVIRVRRARWLFLDNGGSRERRRDIVVLLHLVKRQNGPYERVDYCVCIQEFMGEAESI